MKREQRRLVGQSGRGAAGLREQDGAPWRAGLHWGLGRRAFGLHVVIAAVVLLLGG